MTVDAATSSSIFGKRGLLALLLAISPLAACGGGTEDDSTAATPGASTSTTASGCRVDAPIPPPLPLKAGRCQSPVGFEPTITFTAPAGWYGSGDENEWGVGIGNNEVEQRFEDGGIQVTVLDKPFRKAVTTFQGITKLHAGQPRHGELSEHATATFRTRAPGVDGIGLEALGIGADINRYSFEQIFVDLDGKTLLLRIEIVEKSARASIERVLSTFKFDS